MKLQTKFLAEFLGTSLLVATVIGSGIMAQALAQGNVAIALLANSLATGAMLFVLISILGPISGAHFNPAVSVAMIGTHRLQSRMLIPYLVAQIVGALVGVVVAHAMFSMPLIQVSETLRWGLGQWIAEAVATCGLILTIFGGLRFAPSSIPSLVGLYIIAAYWFTASTSFANPVVTLARLGTDSFTGISPISVLPFVAAQMIGAIIGFAMAKILFSEDQPKA